MTPTTLTQLADRLEKAAGADRELDADLWLAFTPGASRKQSPVNHKASGTTYVIDETRDATHRLITVPEYTASIDAALALAERVLPGKIIRIEINPTLGAHVRIEPVDGRTIGSAALAVTAPTAILAALITDLQQQAAAGAS